MNEKERKMAQKIESGLQMFSRITHRPDLDGLNPTIFPQGPHPGQIIEITGDEATGKTLLVTDLLARCLLPKTYQEVQLPGRKSGALFINTNHHFDMFKLAEIMQYYIKTNCNRTLNSNTVQEIIKESLKSLTVINCYTNEQFQATLLNLESLILENTNISLLIVDTLVAFYWIQRIHSNVSYNSYYTSIVNSLKVLASKFNITVFYTKPNIIKDAPKKHVDIKIYLKKIEEGVFEMEISNYVGLEDRCVRYKIEKTFVFQN